MAACARMYLSGALEVVRKWPITILWTLSWISCFIAATTVGGIREILGYVCSIVYLAGGVLVSLRIVEPWNWILGFLFAAALDLLIQRVVRHSRRRGAAEASAPPQASTQG